MCGIAGVAHKDARPTEPDVLGRMAAAIRHRGPDGYGFFLGNRVGLAHTRLSIIDLKGGGQPFANEDGRIVVVYNGECYNYLELREELIAAGHVFKSKSDTEVLVHGYEEWGDDLPNRLNGQFSFAIYDGRDESLFLCRDRFGVRPLFYAHQRNGDLWFASEVKAILAGGAVQTSPDLVGLDEVFTFWSARAPRTPFAGINQLEPGCLARWRDGKLTVRRYYALSYGNTRDEPKDAVEQLDELMRSSVKFRMRADVPVGGYLSGGLDSSITCALAAAGSPFALRTFSVTFQDPKMDESAYQQEVAADLKSVHAIAPIRQTEIGDVFADVVWHTETPIVRTAPAPMMLLSKLTREGGIKVVLTGEGSDELFMGYDLFKETIVRWFCLRQPDSKVRPRLFDRLYPYLSDEGRGGEFWQRSFLDAGPASDPLFSHLPRFQLTSRIKDAYAGATRSALAGTDVQQELRDALPAEFGGWSPLHRAAYIEMNTLLSGYLLSSQGDRMGLAHSIEGRFPFLDHRLFEFCASLPTRSKLRGLREKDILRRWASRIVPRRVTERAKQPYRAPDVPAFFHDDPPAYLDAMLGDDAIAKAGLFDRQAVAGLLKRCRAGRATGFRENQALVAILSTQLWHHQYFERRRVAQALPLDGADVVMREPAREPISL